MSPLTSSRDNIHTDAKPLDAARSTRAAKWIGQTPAVQVYDDVDCTHTAGNNVIVRAAAATSIGFPSATSKG